MANKLVAGAALAAGLVVGGGAMYAVSEARDWGSEYTGTPQQIIRDLGAEATRQCNELAAEKMDEEYPGDAENDPKTRADEAYESARARATEGQEYAEGIAADCMEEGWYAQLDTANQTSTSSANVTTTTQG